MNGIILFLAAGLGIQHGWHQSDDGTVEYIVQVDEAGLEALRDGLPLTTAVPSDLQRIDRVRIQLGDGPLPQTKVAYNKPRVVPASFQETGYETVEEFERGFVDAVKTLSGNLKADALDAVAVIPDEVAAQTRSVLTDAADRAPVLLQELANKSNGFVATQATQQNNGY